jgi:hypothetical protein
MALSDLLREGWLTGLDWLGGRQAGLRRLTIAGVLGATVLALFGGAQVARAATPQWTAMVTSSTCNSGQNSVNLALNNASSQPVVFILSQETGTQGGVQVHGSPQTPSQKTSSEVWQQRVEPGQTVNRQAGVAPDDDPSQSSVVNYSMVVDALKADGRPGPQVTNFGGSVDACAGQPNPVQQGLQWVAQQGALGMVQLFAGATQAMMQASSTLLGVNGEATSGENDKITSGTSILAETVAAGPTAGDTRYGMMRGIGLIIMVVLITLVVIASLARRQPGESIAAIFIWAPLALIAGGVVFFFADALIGSVDQITYWMISPDWAQVGAYLTSLQKVYDPNQLSVSSGWQLGVVFIGALLTLISSLVIFVSLLLRTIAIDLLVLFIPLAFAGLVAPWTRNWVGKVVEAFIGLVFTKFVILVLLGTGIVALGMVGGALAPPQLAAANASSQDQVNSLTGIVASFVLLLAAAFAPAFATRLIPMAKGHLEGAIAGGGGYGEAASGGLHQTSAAVYQRITTHSRGLANGVGGFAATTAGQGIAAAGGTVKRGFHELAETRRERDGKVTERQIQHAEQDEAQAIARLRRMEQEQLVRTRGTETPEEQEARQMQAFAGLRRKRSYHDEIDERAEG